MNDKLKIFSGSEDSDDEPTLNLDFNVLQQLVSSRLERHCVRTCRLTKGSNNEIHFLQFDNGPEFIARLPRDSTHSAAKLAFEVAIMKYISFKIPKSKCQ